METAEIVVVAYGIAARIVRSAVAKARAEGIKAGWIRPITLWPFPNEQIRGAVEQMASEAAGFRSARPSLSRAE